MQAFRVFGFADFAQCPGSGHPDPWDWIHQQLREFRDADLSVATDLGTHLTNPPMLVPEVADD